MDALIQPMRHGVCEEIEAKADMLIFTREFTMLGEIAKHETGIQTRAMLEMRDKRTVYNWRGVADGARRMGVYRRSANTRQTWLNSRSPNMHHDRGPTTIDGRRTFWEIYEDMGTTDFGRIEPVWMKDCVLDDPHDAITVAESIRISNLGWKLPKHLGRAGTRKQVQT